MRKEDLKVGYVVEHASKELAIIVPRSRGELILLDINGRHSTFENMNQDMEYIEFPRLNITKVFGFAEYNSKILSISTDTRPLLWEREKPVIELTLEEIAKLKGCSVDQIRIKD